MSGERPVEFCVIGAMKSGTTSLWRMMDWREDFSVRGRGRRAKEVGFFMNPLATRLPGWRRRYDRLLPARRGASFRGEVHPSYLYFRHPLRGLKRIDPQIRLIVLLREPAARAVSHWRMNRDRGREPRGLEAALADDLRWRRRYAAGAPGRTLRAGLGLAGFRWRRSYVDRGFYGEQMAHALQLFDRDQMLVMKAEEMAADHGAAWARIAGFLGAPVEPVPPAFAVNASEAEAPPPPPDLAALFKEDQALLERLIPGASHGKRPG